MAECLARHGVIIPVIHLGLPDTFIEQGEHAKLLADCGLDAAGLQKTIAAAAGTYGSTT